MALRAVGRVIQLDEARRAIGSLPDAEDAAETLLFESDLVEHGDLHGETGELGQRRVGDVLRAEPLCGDVDEVLDEGHGCRDGTGVRD
jgi:hypothetical protein